MNLSHPTNPLTLDLSTALYLCTTLTSLLSLILLIFSGDGFDFSQDDILLFPIITLFVSAMTGSIRCFFWTLSFCVKVRWMNGEGEERQIRLGDGDGEAEPKGRWRWVVGVVLSWNAWLAATLMAGLGVLIWRFVENARGRVLLVQAGYGAAFLGAASVLHILLAIPGFGDRKFLILCYPFKEEYQLLGEEDEGA